MKITQFTDFSFRLLLYLARSGGRVVTVREVAEHYAISSEHLKKIVRRLTELGHVRTVRGKLGGLLLARSPAEIDLGRLVRDQENLALLPCHEGCDSCPAQDCKLKLLVDEALVAFLGCLDGRTLADIV